MTFSIVGTGNIAWFFGNRLVTARHHCTGVYSRNKEHAKALADALFADSYGAINDIEDGRADVCFLAVSDSGIAEVAAILSTKKAAKGPFKQTVLVHTAGAMPIDVISMAATDRAVLWPIYSILKHNLPTHRNIPCAWDVSGERAKKYLLEMAHAITDNLFEAKYEQRKWLHLSAVIGNNFINHLLAICERICADNKIPRSALQPIIEQTFDRTRHAVAQSLQTGPAIRNDTTTIDAQLTLLVNHPEWQKVYEAITESIKSHSVSK